MPEKIEYFLKFWGGAQEAIAQELGTTQTVYYFATQAERDALVARIQPYEHLGLVMDMQEGEMRHCNTVALLAMAYKGHTYVYEHDFGPEYPEAGVLFMYEDGNYACDCNRSIFIQKEGHPEFPALECGHEVQLVRLQIMFKELKA